MALKFLPPLPIGTLPGSFWWNDWYEKMRQMLNTLSQSISWSTITGTPTTLAGYGITDAAQLNGVGRITVGVDTTDDIITDSTTTGPVMKSPNGHYWRAAISNLGIVTWTDLGTTKP